MLVPFLDLKRQYKNIKTEIDDAIQTVLGSQQFILGQEVEEFENKIRWLTIAMSSQVKSS